MKKLLALLVGAAIAVSTLCMTACGGGDSTFNGDYKTEATAEEITALQDVDTTKFFSVENGIGFDVSASMSISVTKGTETNKISVSLGDKFTMNPETMEIKNAGEYSVKMSGKDAMFESVSGNVYLTDLTSVYVSAKMKGGEQEVPEMKLKMDLDSIGGMMLAEDTAGDVSTPDVSEEPGSGMETELPSFSEAIAMAHAMGVKFYIDNTDGYKIKMSATQETLNHILEEAEDLPAGATGVLKKLDIYIVIDAEGALVGVKVDEDIELNLGTMKLSMAGEFVLKAWNGTVTLPGADELAEYAPFSMGGGGNIGGGNIQIEG